MADAWPSVEARLFPGSASFEVNTRADAGSTATVVVEEPYEVALVAAAAFAPSESSGPGQARSSGLAAGSTTVDNGATRSVGHGTTATAGSTATARHPAIIAPRV